MAQGLARKLLPGFLAIAVFMTGDGFELTFLSKYVVDQGFSSSQASLLFTMYGLVAALAGWSSGVLAELFGAKRIMLIGAGSWIVLHLVFIGVALPSHSYPLMLASYMLRGMGYPLFIYSFVVLLAQTVDTGKLASAMGWFWTSYSFGIGVFGAYLPAFITPVIGEYYSLWVSLPFSIVGMIICLCFVPKTRNANLDTMSSSDKLRELSRGVTILSRQPPDCACCRIACDLQSHFVRFSGHYAAVSRHAYKRRRSLVPGHRMVHHLGSAVRRHRIRQCVLGPYGRLLRLDEPDALVGLLALRARYSRHVLCAAAVWAQPAIYVCVRRGARHGYFRFRTDGRSIPCSGT